MKLLILLVAPVQDSIANGTPSPNSINLGMVFLVLLITYFGIAFIAHLLNNMLRDTKGHCSEDSSFIPIMHFVCILCHIKNFLTPSVNKKIRERNAEIRAKQKKQKQDKLKQKLKEKQEKVEALMKERTKGLIEI